jgi:hypothetical protein
MPITTSVWEQVSNSAPTGRCRGKNRVHRGRKLKLVQRPVKLYARRARPHQPCHEEPWAIPPKEGCGTVGWPAPRNTLRVWPRARGSEPNRSGSASRFRGARVSIRVLLAESLLADATKSSPAGSCATIGLGNRIEIVCEESRVTLGLQRALLNARAGMDVSRCHWSSLSALSWTDAKELTRLCR